MVGDAELGAGARTTGHVRITSHRAQVSWSSGEVVVEAMIQARVAASAAVSRAMRGSRETTIGGNNVIIIRTWLLPVDGLQTLVETLGAAQLPFAEDGPKNGDTTEGGKDSNEDSNDAAFVLVLLSGSRHRRGGSLLDIV